MEPLVLIPGLLCTEALYAPQISALADRPIMVADHRRHETMREIAEDILANAPERFALAGLSMGGYVALEIMRIAPERVSRLALLDTTARPDTPEQTENRNKQIALTRNGAFERVAPALFPLFVHENREDDAQLRATVIQMARETGGEAFIRQQRAIMSRSDARPLLSRIECPVMVVVGDGDRLTPIDRAKEIHGGIPGSRLDVVADCGHLPTLERPEAVTKLFREWLSPAFA
ncbi:alpha/beta fold hydrolase [Rhizobiales bacterium]|uniref:alpha/beta fold hydrolase n=1 Tax=Hongsoonwoonella zoysiae TaxID=2821844 RepID=UPI00155FE23A|nr:alpha/beta fold hydrolase [Hongsoonwoonella zoysiae]NRG17186.1 alpha/beta fold hydrolase [Hongsoonwoonella zoysiae]